MLQPDQHPISSAQLRARIAGRAEPRRRFDPPSVLIVAGAMLSVPAVMWLVSLLVSWSA